MRILFTGGSSFTGYWFIKELVAAGHRVCAALHRREGCYEGLRAQRVAMVKGLCETVFDCPFGSSAFLSLIDREAHWDLLCHHASDVTDYRSLQFDPVKALGNNTLNLRSVLERLKAKNCRKVLLTGSVFEQGEGEGTDPERAFSPYGLSKGLTSDMFRYYCLEQKVALGKFVIPNPFGPYEEARFTSYLLQTWFKGDKASVKTPDYIRDNIHVSLLALAYSQSIIQLDDASIFTRFSPSGYVESQRDFVVRMADAMRPRLDLPCAVEFAKQVDFLEPRIRVNTQPVIAAWNEAQAWDGLASYYKGLFAGGRH